MKQIKVLFGREGSGDRFFFSKIILSLFYGGHHGFIAFSCFYLIFISLGLPDSLLGSGWPKMQVVFYVPSSYAGYVSMTISFMTIVSALISPVTPC